MLNVFHSLHIFVANYNKCFLKRFLKCIFKHHKFPLFSPFWTFWDMINFDPSRKGLNNQNPEKNHFVGFLFWKIAFVIVKLGSRSKGSRSGPCPNFKVSKYLHFKVFLKIWPGPGAWSYNCNVTTHPPPMKLFV